LKGSVAMNKKSLRYYQFGPFRLNVTERLLHHGNATVPVTPKVFDTLLVLVENSGHVMGKNELMELLWPDSFVEESSLTQNIFLIRRALGEPEGDRQYIETIPKRGYRFVADVRELFEPNGEMFMQEPGTQILVEGEQFVDDSEDPAAQPGALQVSMRGTALTATGHLKLAVLAVSVVVLSVVAFLYLPQRNRTTVEAFTPRSIAVLPFRTLGPQTETDLLGLGMADAIINRMNRQSRVTVLPISSVFKYTAREADALSAARELDVDAVLDGTVQRDGDRVRVTIQLISLRDGRTVWSGKYDRSYHSIFALQDAISEEVASALMPNMPKETRDHLANHLTENKQAYEEYLTGLYFWNKRTKENLAKAIDYLEQAVRKDNNFAAAHALLADAYYLSFQDGYQLFSRSEALNKAKSSVDRALQLDESIAEAHTVRAGIAFCEKRFDEADQEFRRALTLNPNVAVVHLRYGYFLFANFRIGEAVSQMKQAVDLDPVSPVMHAALGHMLFMARDFDGAIREDQKALELQPDSMLARLNLIQHYLGKGEIEKALTESETFDNSDQVVGTRERAYSHVVAGNRGMGLRIVSNLRHSKDRNRIPVYDYAAMYAAIGDKDTALEHLKKMRSDVFTNAYLRFDPQLDSLRGDKRFADFLSRR
jgi:TolB-like protein/DNA-binding winged helix-turn-helix (wHTH) protein/Tfp pilus assembly protein PilF